VNLRRLLSILFFLFLSVSISLASDKPVQVLMYHHILDVGKGCRRATKDLCCPPDIFKDHLNYLLSSGYRTITFKDAMLGIIPPKSIILSFDDGCFSHWYAFQKLSEHKMVGVFFVISGSVGKRKYLTIDQLKSMSKGGMEIGSHTGTHPYLTKISQERLSKEILGSKTKLEDLLGTRVISFAYPYGKYNKKAMEEVENSGYYYARTTNEGVSEFGREKNFELKVVYIHNYTTDLGKVLK